VFDTFNGLPVHPLVVHAVVVLLPLAVIGTIALAVRPAWRRPYGPLLCVVAALAVLLCPVATSSGEQLEKHVGDPGQHAALGDQLVWFAIPVLVLAAGMTYLARRHPHRTPGPSWLPAAVSVLAVVAAVACGVQVFRVGDSGARAAWGDQVAQKADGS